MQGKRAKILALAFGFFVAFACAEILVRVLEPPKDTEGVPLPGSDRVYGYEKNISGVACGVPFQTNSDGFRGPEIDGRGDELIVVAIGDSYTFGYGVAYEEAFPAVLETILEDQEPGRSVRVINLGIPGYNTRQAAASLREIAPKIEVDLVLLGYHLNDIQEPYTFEAEDSGGLPGLLFGLREHLHVLRVIMPQAARFARAIGWDIKTTSSIEIDHYLGDSEAWQKNQEELLKLEALAQELGASLAVIVLPYVIQLDERHPPRPAYDVIVSFLQSQGIPAASAFDSFVGMDARNLWVSLFDGHPNAQGHRIMASVAAELLVPLIPPEEDDSIASEPGGDPPEEARPGY